MEERTLPWIDEDTLAKTYPKIYHYTDFQTLSAILDTGGIFATLFSETNDREEYRSAKHILCPAIETEAKEYFTKNYPELREAIIDHGDDPDSVIRKDSEIFYDSGMKTTPFIPYLSCFSYHTEDHHRENGILTMWRSYCNSSGGIAIEFDTRKLVDKGNLLHKTKKFNVLYFDEVIYAHEGDRLKARLDDCGDLIKMYANFLGAQLSGREPELNAHELIKLAVLSACTKHPDFSDEREIRLVTVIGERAEDQREPVPLIGTKALIEFADCITGIMIGPSRDAGSIEAAVRYNLEKFDRSDITIWHSKTPYRNI